MTNEELTEYDQAVAYNTPTRKELIKEILFEIYRGVEFRLEDIEAFANREVPEKEEILRLTDEIKQHLNKVVYKFLPWPND